MTGLDVRGLSVRLGAAPVVRDVSFCVKPGSLVGLIGPNGAGKSTLLRALAGLEPAEAGSVRLGGRDLAAYSRRELARNLAFLPQAREVHWPLAVERVAALGRLPHLAGGGPMAEADRAAVDRALARTDLQPFRTRRADTLSGGEAARLMLARALAVDAPILLADEPVTSLDPYHQLQGMELLRSVAQEGRVVLTVLHDLTLAGRFCERILLLRNGAIVADGPPAEVLTETNLAAAYAIEGVRGRYEAQSYVLPWRRHEKPARAAE